MALAILFACVSIKIALYNEDNAGKQKEREMENLEAQLIYSYTREQAIADGVLVDLTKHAKCLGFSCSVAITDAAWTKFIDIPNHAIGLQDQLGRMHDVLNMLIFAIKNNSNTSQISFTVFVNDNVGLPERLHKNESSMYHEIKAISGPGDNGELVITLMLPEED